MKSLKHLIAGLLSMVILISCQPTGGDQVSSEATETNVIYNVKEISTDGPEKTTADLEIEGMACEKMCGGSIKKALAGLNGVKSVEIKFDLEQKIDHAVVEYDEILVNEKQLTETVMNLHNGQYKVHSVTIEKHINQTSEVVNPPSENLLSKERYAGGVSYSFPNIFSVFSVFL